MHYTRNLRRPWIAAPLIAVLLLQIGSAASTVSAQTDPSGSPGSFGPWPEPKGVMLKKTTTGNETTALGGEFNYKIEVENRATTSATVVLTDDLPSQVQLVGLPVVDVISPTATFTPSATGPDVLSWQGALSAGAKAAITIRVKLTVCPSDDDDDLQAMHDERGITNAAVMTNRSSGNSGSSISVSSVSFAPSACAKQPKPPGPGGTITPTVPGADMAVRAYGRLHPDWDFPDRGWRASWLTLYGNRGDQTATNASLLDKPSDNQTIDKIRTSPVLTPTTTADGLLFTLGDVASARGGGIAVRATVPFSTAAGTLLTNRVSVSATNDITPANNTAAVSVTIPVLPPLITYPRSGLTFTGTIEIRGKVQTGSSVIVYVDGVPISATVPSGAGDWTQPVQLTDGVHVIYARNASDPAINPSNAQDWREWHRSNAIVVKVDSNLVWDPMSLTFTHSDGQAQANARLRGWLGWHDRDGWYVGLQPSTTYTVSVRVCCTPATVSMTVPSAGNAGNAGSVTMSDPDGDLTFSGSFTTGAVRDMVRSQIKLCVQANGQTQCSTGRIVPVHSKPRHTVIITPDGFDPPRINVSLGDVIEIINLADDSRALSTSSGLSDGVTAQTTDAGGDAVRLEVGESYTVQADRTQTFYNANNASQNVTLATIGGNSIHLPIVRR